MAIKIFIKSRSIRSRFKIRCNGRMNAVNYSLFALKLKWVLDWSKSPEFTTISNMVNVNGWI